MASKCWFVLKQTHYPPPVIPKNGTGSVRGSGAICLGHIIPDLKHMDNIINRHGPLDIPPDMPIHRTKSWNATWEVSKSDGAGGSNKVGVPIAAAAGLSIKLDAAVAFKETIKNFWEFASLDTFILQPTYEYVENSIEDDEVAAYLDKRMPFRTSTLFMITGIKVARGAKIKFSDMYKQEVNVGLGMEFPSILEAGIGANKENEAGVSSAAQKATDFVWAIRLAKISKGLIDKQWSYETFTRGATFGSEQNVVTGQEICDALRREGLGEAEQVDIGPDDDIFIVGGIEGEADS